MLKKATPRFCRNTLDKHGCENLIKHILDHQACCRKTHRKKAHTVRQKLIWCKPQTDVWEKNLNKVTFSQAAGSLAHTSQKSVEVCADQDWEWVPAGSKKSKQDGCNMTQWASHIKKLKHKYTKLYCCVCVTQKKKVSSGRQCNDTVLVLYAVHPQSSHRNTPQCWNRPKSIRTWRDRSDLDKTI